MAKESYAVVPKHRVADCRGFTGDFFFFWRGEYGGQNVIVKCRINCETGDKYLSKHLFKVTHVMMQRIIMDSRINANYMLPPIRYI